MPFVARLVGLILCGVFLLSCKSSEEFQGYIEGEYVYLASSRSGHLEELAIEKGTKVEKGQLLCSLEAELETQALHQAEAEYQSAQNTLADMQRSKRPEEIAMAKAQLDQAKAEYTNALKELRRRERLAPSGAVAQARLEDAQALARTTAAKVEELDRQVAVYNLPEREKRIEAQEALVNAKKAIVAQAQWNLSQKRIFAPEAGLVCDTIYRKGELVSAGSPIIQLLPPANIKLRFFLPEAKLATLRLGQKIAVYLDGREKPILAKVSFISPDVEYTPPVIYSNETRSKLVFMVEAKPEQGEGLHPGQPVRVEVAHD